MEVVTDLDELELDSKIKEILYQDNFVDLESICSALVDYRLMLPEEFEKWISNNYITVLTILPKQEVQYINTMNIKDIERNPLFATLEEELGILVEDGDNAKVYLPLGFDLGKRMGKSTAEIHISNRISRSNIAYYYVSPAWVRKQLGIQPVIKYSLLYKSIIYDAMKRKASDVSFSTVNENGAYIHTINHRINKSYKRCERYPILSREEFEGVFDAMLKGTGRKRSSVTNRHGVTFAVPNVFGEGNTILRGALSEVSGGLSNSVRIQSQEVLNLTISFLGFDEETTEMLKKSAHRREGLTMFTGPINTGKSISMMSVSKETESQDVKQYGLFDPQEFLVPYDSKDYNGDIDTLVNEVTLMKKKDVDIAYVSEIPNKQVAIELKDLIVTNVHVLVTTHLNRCWDIPNKLEGLYGTDWVNILSYLNTVFNQKMFIKPCPHCGKLENIDLSTLNPMYREFAQKYEVTSYMDSKGCIKCMEGEVIGGYSPIAEFIDFTPELVEEMLNNDSLVRMSLFLRNYLMDNEKALEHKVAKAINEGRVMLSSIQEFI